MGLIILAAVPPGDRPAFRAARGMHPPLDPVFRDQPLESEARGNHPDRAHDRGRIGPDVIRRTGEPIAARGRDILDEGMHRHLRLIGKAPDPRRDQRALHRRAAGRIDDQRHGHGLALAKGALDHRFERGIRKPLRARPHRADRALKPDHGNARGAAATKAGGEEAREIHALRFRRCALRRQAAGAAFPPVTPRFSALARRGGGG